VWRARASPCAAAKLAAMRIPSSRWFAGPAFDTDTEAPCGTSVAQAREALSYWRGRLGRLPWYRRSARAEAREMARRWQRRLLQAHLERWRLGAFSSHAMRVADRWTPGGASRSALRLTVLVVRATTVGRLLAALAFTTLLCAVTLTVLAAVVLGQLL
jgi:hypothetical protein